jgi:CheY-like chemotaxis protein
MSYASDDAPGIVLVIDDDAMMTDLIKEILIDDGHDVHIANDGHTGVRMAGEVKPDLVLMDITMPGLDGYEATKLIKQVPELREIPIVFLTGRTNLEDSNRAFAHGGVSYVRKPFTCQQIKDLVKLALAAV